MVTPRFYPQSVSKAAAAGAVVVIADFVNSYKRHNPEKDSENFNE